MSSVVLRLRRIPTWQLTLGLALLALGFIVAAQLRSEPQRIRYTTQERTPLIETVRALQAQQDLYKTQILEIRRQISTLERGSQGSTAVIRTLNEDLEASRIAAGLVALQGPGLVIELDDSQAPVPPDANVADYRVSARDVRSLIEELWLAGAEAIAVNNERVTPGTAFIDIGSSVLVNSAYLVPPYQVSSIGPADLYDRLTESVGFVDFVRSRADSYGIGIRFAELADVAVPAYAGSVNLRYAHPAASPTAPSPSPGPTTAPSARPSALRAGESALAALAEHRR